ncbi:MAG: EAL domain-containing protein [Ilumatobacteraceae bacterium]
MTGYSAGSGDDFRPDRATSAGRATHSVAVWTRPAALSYLDELMRQLRHDPVGAANAARELLAEVDASDHDVVGLAHNVLGYAQANAGLVVEALATLKAGREVLQRAEDPRLLCRLLYDIAGIRGNQLGQTAEALAGFEEALRIARASDSAVDEGRVLSGMGVMLGRMERWDESERALRRSVELLSTSELGDYLGAAVNNLSYLLALRGRPEEGLAPLREALAQLDPARDPRTVMTLRCTLSLALGTLGDTEGALVAVHFEDALLAAADPYLRVVQLDTIGRVHLKAGSYEQAAIYLRKAVHDADAHSIPALAVESVRSLAEAAEAAGDLRAALLLERDLRRRERSMLDEAAAASLRQTELMLEVEASNRENRVLEAARSELATRVDERTAELRAEVEERGKAEARAARLARIDWLTGLPNRRHFEAALSEGVSASAAETVALYFVDLDHFKSVNDRYGHLAGDDVLQSAATRLSLVAPEGALVARFGGDEFVMVATVADDMAAEVLAGELVAGFAAPLFVAGQRLQVSCSVGLAVHPDGAGDAATLLQRADNALVHAKAAGRNCWRRLDTAAWQQVTFETRVSGELADAAERDELSLAYQPQWRVADGRCDAIEALLRWQHPELGAIEPGLFIPIAEDGGMICQLGRWVLDRACRAAVLIDAVGHPALADHWTIAVNVSVRQLQQAGFAEELAEVVTAAGWPLDRLELEITESMQHAQNDAVSACVAAIRRLGTRVAIDDFGTGYASFGQLERLGVSKLKLDRSLIQLLDGADGAAARPSLTEAMIRLGHSLGMLVTAEGVETHEQLALLTQQGCDAIQGFVAGRPVAEHLLAEELNRGCPGLLPVQ